MKISIISVVLNNKDFIEDCINSVLSQTYNNIEYIIIDGGSTDGTVDIIRKYGNKIARWVSEPDRGIYDAMNKGIRMATGDVVGLLNADDVYANDRVIEKVSESISNKSAESCYGDIVYVDALDAGKVRRFWHSGPYHKKRFFQGWMPPHPAFFVRRRAYEKYGFFNLALGTAADYELMLRFLVKHKITTYYIPEVLVKMRMGGQSNASLKKRLTANRMDRKAWAVNGMQPNPWTLLMKPLSKVKQYFFTA